MKQLYEVGQEVYVDTGTVASGGRVVSYFNGYYVIDNYTPVVHYTNVHTRMVRVEYEKTGDNDFKMYHVHISWEYYLSTKDDLEDMLAKKGIDGQVKATSVELCRVNRSTQMLQQFY